MVTILLLAQAEYIVDSMISTWVSTSCMQQRSDTGLCCNIWMHLAAHTVYWQHQSVTIYCFLAEG